ncbi:TonB-dependent receptor [Rhodocaloribacter litoris]|uniref:TonB-dependent receptor plug domain-containing protein n=1 Tax=Rhodocaloribacter litoris TaxID=2558931 RepID=UPI00141DA67D|nr:TonB-dependent receptor [Rhodocaloribacter litoris]QXD17069.1 TonB-dependent receptor [Rhodocaloribacter litoris]
MSVRFLLIVCWVALEPVAAGAQVPRDTVVALPGVTVTATRSATTTAAAPARVTLLDARALAAVAPRSVADLLEARTGAFMRRYGPAGLASLTLRGTAASQTLILFDGFRLTDPQLGQLDLSLLPAGVLESAEVFYGAGSALYGTDAVGGVVSLQPLRPGAAAPVRLVAGAGAYGERTGSLTLSGRRGAVAALAAVEYRTTDGDFPYVNTSLFPPRKVRREGADGTHLSLFSTLGYTGGRHRLRAGAWYAQAERGLPGPSTTVPRGERQWDEHLRLWARDAMRLARGTLRLGAMVQRGTLRYLNPQLRLDQTGRTTLASLEAEATLALGARSLLGGGLTAGYGKARHPGLRDDASEQRFGAFAHADLACGPARLYPALRLDVYALPEGARTAALSPRLGLNLRPLDRDGLRLKASAGRAFRTPTFNDRFWQPGGNPTLRPEHGWTFDAGLLLHHRTPGADLRAEVSAFLHRLRDQIIWRPVAGGYYAPANFSRVRTRGLEVSAEARLRPGRRNLLEAGLFYAHTDARDRSDPGTASFDRPLRYVPRHQLKLYAGFGRAPLQLDVTARYVGRRFVTADGRQALDPYWVTDAQLRLFGGLPPARLTLALVLENVFDRTYEGIKGYPMPPRTFRLRLLLELGGGA